MEDPPRKGRWSHFSDEQLRKVFLKNCRENCRPEMEAYVECSKKEGLLVWLNCREQNRKQNECAAKYSTNEAWNKFRRETIEKLVAEGKIQPFKIEEQQIK